MKLSLVYFYFQIYIEAKLDFDSCIRVTKDDRLGIYFPMPMGSVPYAFDPKNPRSLLYEHPDPDVPVNISQVVNFITLNFPYDFSMSAYIDSSKTVLQCSTIF